MEFTVKLARRNFFDRAAVIRRTDAATRRNHSKFGAFLRQNARRSLKYQEATSSAGDPPAVHKTMTRPGKVSKKTGKAGKPQGVSPLREFLFFAQDPARKSVVVGPAKLNAKLGDAPRALEYGGTSEVRIPGGGTRMVRIRARPYVRPALSETIRELPAIWRDSIKR